MVTTPSMDILSWLRKQVAEAAGDLLREVAS